MLRFRSQSIAQITQFFANREFVQTHPPIITSSDCEGAGEVFTVATGSPAPTAQGQDGSDDESFFRSPKYLTVSSQLHLEALAQSVGKVWTLSPTFRAEKSDTARHLSEFYMLEAEINFEEKASGIMDLIEDMLRDLTKGIYSTKTGQELLHGRRAGEGKAESQTTITSEILEIRWQGMMSGPWPRISYSEAIEILQQSNEPFKHKPTWGLGLQAEHERYIATAVGKGQPVFVTAYPKSIKPFYMMPSNGLTPLGETVECFDLLVPEVCEIVGGSMREYRLPELIGAMKAHGIVPQDADLADGELLGGLRWYVDLRRWGSVPHGGFGLGFDRLLSYLSGAQNIREVVAFPRWVGRCEC
jgi:asparaginyl-tRNA synthetase